MQIKNDNQFSAELDAYIREHMPVSCDTIVRAMRDLGYDCSPRMVRPRLREMGLHVKNVHKERLWGRWDDENQAMPVLPVVAEKPSTPKNPSIDSTSTETQEHQAENAQMTQERNALWEALQKTAELKSAQERLLVEIADLIHSTYGQTHHRLHHHGNQNRKWRATNDPLVTKIPETSVPSMIPDSVKPAGSKPSKPERKARVEQTSVGRVINGWKIIEKVQKASVNGAEHPIYRGICPVCGAEKDQRLTYFRTCKSCGCAKYAWRAKKSDKSSEKPGRPRKTRKRGERKPGALILHADMPETQQEMLSDTLGPCFSAMQNLTGDRFLLMLDAFQGDDIQMPTTEQVERRIILVKIASEFCRLKAKRGSGEIDLILDDMAQSHKTSTSVIREMLRLASIELKNAQSEYAFQFEYTTA